MEELKGLEMLGMLKGLVELEMLVLLKREILLFAFLTFVTVKQWDDSRPRNADVQSYTHLSDGRAILLGGLKMLKGLDE